MTPTFRWLVSRASRECVGYVVPLASNTMADNSGTVLRAACRFSGTQARRRRSRATGFVLQRFSALAIASATGEPPATRQAGVCSRDQAMSRFQHSPRSRRRRWDAADDVAIRGRTTSARPRCSLKTRAPEHPFSTGALPMQRSRLTESHAALALGEGTRPPRRPSSSNSACRTSPARSRGSRHRQHESNHDAGVANFATACRAAGAATCEE